MVHEHAIRFRHDADISGLGALGVESAAQLLGPDSKPNERSELLAAERSRSRLRFPLPGTPDRDGGRLTSRPMGGGTGWVVLERWNRSPWTELFVSRLTHPRSASLAERRWNLLCHLRRHGVGTPQPLAVGAQGAGPVSRDSFLVTRELEDFEPVAEWLAREEHAEERLRGLQSIGATLANLLRAAVLLPELSPDHFVISKASDSPGDACGWRAELAPHGLPMNRLPSVVLTEVDRGSIRTRLEPREIASMLAALDDPALCLEPRERVRLLHAALRSLPRDVRVRVRRSLPRAS